MNNEEKMLEILSQMQGDISALKGDVSTLKGDMSRMQGDMARMQGDMARMQGDMARMQGDISSLKETQEQHGEAISELQKTVTRVALTQENIVLKSLDALAEGQVLTHQRLKTLATKEETDELRDEMLLLRSVVAQHTRDIEALKAAQ